VTERERRLKSKEGISYRRIKNDISKNIRIANNKGKKKTLEKT
jgi:hypothetical protein